jgi:hypothetical protein
MATTERARVRFDDTDTRSDEMHSTIEQWAQDLVEGVDDARASEQFQQWLDVQQRFHDYSYRNTLLITLQCPEATKVAGYNTWQTEFDRQVKQGEEAIWIWAPIIAPQCPDCGNSPDYHADTDCEYDATEPDEWSEGPVAFKPVPVFDVSQTEGEPLPELDTAATGDATQLLPALCEAASTVGASVSLVDPDEWTHGDARGVCQAGSDEPTIEVLDQETAAATAGTLIHEYAHALLHVGVDDDTERTKRELEAEAVAYIVGRHYGLNMDGSTFYLASWAADDAEVILDRLDRISHTATTLLEATDSCLPG